MKKRAKRLIALTGLPGLVLLLALPGYAYVDPTAATFLISWVAVILVLLLPGIVVGLVFLIRYIVRSSRRR